MHPPTGRPFSLGSLSTDRPFAELNLWQRIFAEHWERFVAAYQAEHQRPIPSHWEPNVRQMLSWGDFRQGYSAYYCEHCQESRKVGFTCKSRLCLRCCKVAVDGWLETARRVLFEGVVHRQIVLTIPKPLRPLVLAEPADLAAADRELRRAAGDLSLPGSPAGSRARDVDGGGVHRANDSTPAVEELSHGALLRDLRPHRPQQGACVGGRCAAAVATGPGPGA